MKNVCLIGYGNWGKIVFKSLKKIKSIKKIFIIKSRKNKNTINLNNVDWVIITATNTSHFSLVKKYLNLKKNVFCEKPLTLKFQDDLKLYKIAKKNKCKVYVSDIERYKKKKLSILKKNEIYRSKFSSSKKDILYRLTYHDFTYLFQFLKPHEKIKIKIIKSNKGFLKFALQSGVKDFIFTYNLNAPQKIHKFNNTNLITKKNILQQMISKVINKKVDFSMNEKISLFSHQMCLKILRKIEN
tara:strand:+ start:1963 stop:2688 length:726 start_codon:yes stop_codon:yes gene_type:complete